MYFCIFNIYQIMKRLSFIIAIILVFVYAFMGCKRTQEAHPAAVLSTEDKSQFVNITDVVPLLLPLP